MADLIFAAQFVTAQVGKTGLTVTVDVDRYTISDGSRTALVTGGAATEGRRGLYSYRLASANLALYQYIATFITTNTTVDQQEIPTLGLVVPDALTSAVSAVVDYASVRTAVGLASANLDTQLDALPTAAEVATAAAAAILVTPANKLATGSVGEADANVIFWNGSSVAPTDANGNVPALLCETQPSVTFGQIKIRASVDGQGAIDVLNAGLTGIGIYVEGQTGQKNVGTNTGVYNYGGSYGQVNEGPGDAGVYNTGASPVGGVDSWGIRNAIGMADPNMDIQLAAVAKTGADGDTLKTLSDQLDSVGGVNQQDIADALLLAPVGVAADGSAMDYLADIAAAGGMDLDTVLETPVTLGEALRVMLAALAGKTDGSGTPALTFLGQDGATVRISATVDGIGNRTAVTVDGA